MTKLNMKPMRKRHYTKCYIDNLFDREETDRKITLVEGKDIFRGSDNMFPKGIPMWHLKMYLIKFMYRHFKIEHACYMVPDISKPSGMIYETICTICGATGVNSM